MTEIKRILPYPTIFVRAVALDIVESISEDATVDKEHWKLSGTMKIYGIDSFFSMEIDARDDEHTVMEIKMLKPNSKLSTEGKNRAISFLADSIEQLLENTFV